MKKYFSQLRPLERRLAVGGFVALIVVLNWWLVWPHFSDWSNLRRQLDDAQKKLKLYQATVAQIPDYQAKVKAFESRASSSHRKTRPSISRAPSSRNPRKAASASSTPRGN